MSQDRAEYARLDGQLDGLARLFRQTQGRLMTRYQDKIPTSIEHLDRLLETIFDEVRGCAQSYHLIAQYPT